MITPASHPSVFLLLCLPQSTSIQLYKRYSVLNPGPSTVQHTLVCANSRPYLYSHPYLLYLLGKPIHYQSVTASTWISLSRTVSGILVQDTHSLTSHIALVVTGDTNSNTSALIHYTYPVASRMTSNVGEGLTTTSPPATMLSATTKNSGTLKVSL